MNINKHLTYEERTYIESGLNNGRTITDIAISLNKDKGTISKEIKKRKIRKLPSGIVYGVNLCKHKLKCREFKCNETKSCYEEDICDKLKKGTKVCNFCEEKSNCRKIKYYYYAKIANDKYRYNLRDCRIGINASEEEIKELDDFLAPLIAKNQSINHILANNPDKLNMCRQTLLNYINQGVFSFRNIDMVRRVRYKKRIGKSRTKVETKIRINRTYKDFLEYIEKNPNENIVEMDTVEGAKGGKVWLTLLFRNTNFMLMYLMDSKIINEVERVFNEIRTILGKDLYIKLFNIILTDNGSEFFNTATFEMWDNTAEQVTKLFYCDPGASWQKGSLEKNHEFIRYVVPKGNSIDELTQETTKLIENHINNYVREIFNNKTPYEMEEFFGKKDFLDKIKSKKIKGNDVNLSSSLLK